MRIILWSMLLYFCVIPTGIYAQEYKELEQYLEKNPQILLNFIKKHAQEIVTILVQDVENTEKQAQEEEYRKLKREWEQQKNRAPLAIDIAGYPALRQQKTKHTFVVYSDFLCPHCAGLDANMLKFLEKNPTVQYVLKNYSSNPLSKKAYAYFYAIWKQSPSLAWQYAQILFKSQSILLEQKDTFLQFAVTAIGLDPTKIAVAAQSKDIESKIDAAIKEGAQLKLPGTPVLIVDNRYILIGESSEYILQQVLTFADN